MLENTRRGFQHTAYSQGIFTAIHAIVSRQPNASGSYRGSSSLYACPILHTYMRYGGYRSRDVSGVEGRADDASRASPVITLVEEHGWQHPNLLRRPAKTIMRRRTRGTRLDLTCGNLPRNVQHYASFSSATYVA